MGRFRKSSYTSREVHHDRHRFEHWYRDNTLYFITSKARDGRAVFERPDCRSIFWDRYEHWADAYGFVPWVTSLLNNHYHTLGYLKVGTNLGPFMQKLHGSVAKLVNDRLDERHVPFWRSRGNKDYFDGCIRNVRQADRAFRYILTQAVRARIVKRWEDYPDTKLAIPFDRAIARAKELNVFLEDVPYKRYEGRR